MLKNCLYNVYQDVSTSLDVWYSCLFLYLRVLTIAIIICTANMFNALTSEISTMTMDACSEALLQSFVCDKQYASAPQKAVAFHRSESADESHDDVNGSEYDTRCQF